MAIPMLAQFSEPGFYRIQNKGAAKRYVSIVNNRVESRAKEVEITAGFAQEISVWSLQTVKDPIADPGTVIYISGSSSDLVLEAKGMNTKSLLGQYKLQTSGNSLFSEAKGTMVYLVDSYEMETTDNGVTRIIGNKVAGEYGQYKGWEFIKIDNKEEYFATIPELKIGDKYYTTMYTSFAYELPDGIKAYYVDDHEYVKAVSPVAELKEIIDYVPAATPVILECSSDKAEDNILKPLAGSDAPSAIADNELSGIYFCGYLMFGGKERTQEWYTNEWKNVTNYDEETMRVLGTDANGNLALIPATDKELEVTNVGKYLPANKAYFKINANEADATKNGIKLLSKADFDTATSIKDIPNEGGEGGETGINSPTRNSAKSGIMTLAGTRVRSGNSTEGLPKGIYIVNGKKVIVR